jgi:hypothetical protein
MSDYDQARDTFAKVGDYDTVEDVSDAPWPGAERARIGRAITPPPPGPSMSHRTAIMINAETGQALCDLTERAAADSARHLSIRREHVDRMHPSARSMLEHIFGLNLSERDRA